MVRETRWYIISTLFALFKGPSIVSRKIDTPLEQAIRESRTASAWAAVSIALALVVTQPAWLRRLEALLSTVPAHQVAVIFVLSIATIVAIPLVYGIVRLYTLVGHVMTLNVFKARGQRLRLLNLHSVLLSLALPLAIGIMLHSLIPVLGAAIEWLIAVYFVWLINFGYNLIFHRQRFHGLLLWMGGTLVTWFVLGIGLLAILVTAGVIGFFVVAVLRLGTRHTPG